MMRIEKDSMGEVKVPNAAYWGAQTQRSLENFKIGDETMPIELLEALVLIKKTAARANALVGKLPEEKAVAIEQAADELLQAQKWDDFPLVIWQTGSGTQTNMNVNEVLAHLANKAGTYVHPNDDVNMSQSSNDVFPSAIHLATTLSVTQQVLPAIKKTVQELKKIEQKNQQVIKIGRTHLQDATPITFAQEVSGWRVGLEKNQGMLEACLVELMSLAIGGTAVGTGLNASKAYEQAFIEQLRKETGLKFKRAKNKFHALANQDTAVFTSGALKATAANAFKMANDIRLLASGPRSGLGELRLPENEPGSSIMPGKVNPTQCEALTMVAVQVMGNDSTIGMAGSLGNFELNVYLPLIAYNLLQSCRLLATGLVNFTEKCLVGLTVNQEKMTELVERSLMLVTALNPQIGYDKGAEIAKKAFTEGLTLKQAALATGYLTEKEYDALVRPEKMVGEC